MKPIKHIIRDKKFYCPMNKIKYQIWHQAGHQFFRSGWFKISLESRQQIKDTLIDETN